MAGINAHQKIIGEDPLILKRSEAYIGVLIDDLISKGTEEPYRMFTSRAEFRTLLRQDNADLRLTPASYRLGLASQQRMDDVLHKKNEVERIKQILSKHSLEPDQVATYLESKSSSQILQKQKAIQLLLRPDIGLQSMINSLPMLKKEIGECKREIIEQAEIQIKYETYINKEKELVQKMSQLEDLNIPESFDYDRISSLSTEAMQKFKRIKPRTLGQASRISGVNPSDIQILMVYMGR